MMKSIILWMFLAPVFLNAQDSLLCENRSGDYLNKAIWSKSLNGVVFLREYLSDTKKDTLLLFQTDPINWLKCTGNDSVFVYYQDGLTHVMAVRFEKSKNKWDCHFGFLPPLFTFTGVALPNDVLEKYEYAFQDDGQTVEAIKSVFIVTKEGKLLEKPDRKYKVVLKYSPNSTDYQKVFEEQIY